MDLSFLSKIGFQIKKHSPEILMGTGIVGTVVSTVLACKATPKAVKVIEEHNSTMAAIKSCKEKSLIPSPSGESIEYTKKMEEQDIIKTYAVTAKDLAKIYAPSVILFGASVASILGGHHIINKRYASMTAAYVALDASYKGYRKKVADKLGEAAEKELRYDVKTNKKDVEVVDTETGELKKKKENVKEVGDNPSFTSPYARFFDESSPYWRKDPEANLMFLRGVQDNLNEKLKKKGHLYLNDVYQALGLQESKVKCKAGWIYDKNSDGDDYIDFGIYDQNGDKLKDEAKRRFVNGLEWSILLDFNCVPDIYASYAGGLS